jgi:hypothetical protein
MTSANVQAVVRRLFPWRVRIRLAVLYAALFLLAGAALLALTYVLVAHVLLPPVSTKSIPPRLGDLLGLCRQRQAPGQPAMSVSLVEKCNTRSLPPEAEPKTSATASWSPCGASQ